MKKILTTFKRDRGESGERRFGERRRGASPGSVGDDDSPEGRIIHATRSFCESGGPQSENSGEEVLHLPTIVDIAESSPASAREAANVIRKQLDLKNNSSRPHVQYNAVMLMRILADNPGGTFTRNLAEPKFASAVKDLLRNGKDPSVRQILCESLEYFEVSKGGDEGLKGLRDVWSKEKRNMAAKNSKTAPLFGGGSSGNGGGYQQYQGSPVQYQQQQQHQQQHQQHQQRHQPSGLPGMEELTARISEAQTSAKLLGQVLQSTPQAEVPSNDLIKEFADRCKVATRSIQSYISSTDPSPDEDTMTTLIMTNDLLTMALTRHQKTVKEALEKREVHKKENARITNVDDPSLPSVPVTLPPITPDREHYSGHDRDSVVPDSPVSPVTPGPVTYRY